LDLRKDQPAEVPAAGAGRVSNYLPLRLIQEFGAERVVLCQASKLAEKVVGVDVVGPSTSHRFGDVRGVESGEYLLYATKFYQGVDTVGLQ